MAKAKAEKKAPLVHKMVRNPDTGVYDEAACGAARGATHYRWDKVTCPKCRKLLGK